MAARCCWRSSRARARDRPHRPVRAARLRADARDRRARRPRRSPRSAGAQPGTTRKDIGEIAVPVVIGGVIGARVYHLFTGYKWSDGGIVGAFEIWKGGLSIWGAVAGGADRGRDHRRARATSTLLVLLDAIAPGVVVAQAIGRWGNYFNQELFGRPTQVAVGARDRPRAPAGRATSSTRRSIRRSSTSRSGACSSFGTIVWLERNARSAQRGQAFALVRRDVHVRSHLLRVAARRPARRRSSASASTCCSRPCCASSATSGSSGSAVGPATRIRSRRTRTIRESSG